MKSNKNMLKNNEINSNKINQFLTKLKGNTLKYKRYTGSLIRYAGGKTLAVGLIIENFPRNIKRVISPFVGGASIELALSNECGICVKAFDIFDKLINFYQQLKINKQRLLNYLQTLDTSRETFDKVRKRLELDYKGKNIYKDKVMMAGDYFYNHNLSYGPSYLGWASSNYLNNDKKYLKMIKKLEDTNLDNITFECLSFEDVLKKYKNDFLYLDPPYFLGGSSKMFTGIYPMRNNPFHHTSFDHQKLCKLLEKHEGGFVLSYNDCNEIRQMYKNYKIIELEWQYTMGQGETRIGKNRKNRVFDNSNVKHSHEILIIKE